MTEMAGANEVGNLRDTPYTNSLNQRGAANEVAASVSYIQKLMYSDSSAHSESESALSASKSDSESSEEESRRSRRKKKTPKGKSRQSGKERAQQKQNNERGLKILQAVPPPH